jgi:hypothetical protein
MVYPDNATTCTAILSTPRNPLIAPPIPLSTIRAIIAGPLVARLEPALETQLPPRLSNGKY